ncbi:MAG: hypothetical protein V4506_19220 [Bacteroidota bacterium]
MAETTNKKSNKNLVIAIVALVIIFVAIYLYKNSKKDEAELPPPSPTPPNPSSNNSPPSANDSFPLKKGSKGPNVKYLQWALNRINQTNTMELPETDYFGDQTYSALLLVVGTTINGMPTYPMSQKAHTAILSKANNTSARVMDYNAMTMPI